MSYWDASLGAKYVHEDGPCLMSQTAYKHACFRAEKIVEKLNGWVDLDAKTDPFLEKPVSSTIQRYDKKLGMYGECNYNVSIVEMLLHTYLGEGCPHQAFTDVEPPIPVVVLPGVFCSGKNMITTIANFVSDKYLNGWERVLDCGSGSGIAGLVLDESCGPLTAIDINWRAVLNTQINCAIYGKTIRTIFGGPEKLGRKPGFRKYFDVIFFNSPFCIVNDDQYTPCEVERAWVISRSQLRRFFFTSKELISCSGQIFYVVSSESRIDLVQEAAKKAGFECYQTVRFYDKIDLDGKSKIEEILLMIFSS